MSLLINAAVTVAETATAMQSLGLDVGGAFATKDALKPALLQNPLFTIGLPVALFIIMLGMGLSLIKEDFERVKQHPKAVIIGTIGQMVLIPLLGFGIAYAMLGELGAMMAAGLVLVAVLPGGTTSNLLTYLAKANLALSITLTVVASLVTLLTIPILLELALNLFSDDGKVVQSEWAKTMGTVFGLVILPVGIGMYIRKKAPSFAIKMEKPTSIFSMLVMVGIIVLIVIAERDNIGEWLALAAVPTIILNLAAILLAFIISRLGQLPAADTMTMIIELSIKNTTVGMTIAFVVLEESQLGIPAAVYGLLMFVTALILAMISRIFITNNKPEFKKPLN